MLFLTLLGGANAAWGDDVLVYTLDGTKNGGNNGYATESKITQGDVTWMVTGNTDINPWRIGGKNLSGVDRPLYSTLTLEDDISKVVVTNGTASLTVNSMTLIVSSKSDFSSPTSTVSGTFTANNTTTFDRPTGADWSNKYFKIVYNVTTSGDKNQFAQFVKAEFYKASSVSNCVAPTFSPAAGTFTSAQNVTISCETSGATIYYTIDGSTPTTSSSVYSSAIPVSQTTTIKAFAAASGYNNSIVASATYTIVEPLTTMDEIFAAATEAGSTATSVAVKFNNWVVTGVKSSNAYVTDGTKGFIIYQSGHGFEVGNILSGTASCKVQLYNGSAEITNLNSTTTGLTVTTGGTVTPVTTMAIASLAGVNTGAVFSFENLVYDGTNLSDGTNDIQPYTTFYSGTFEKGKTYNVTGVYLQYKNIKEILPRSEADIVEVVITDPVINADATLNLAYDAISGEIAYTIDNSVEGTSLSATTNADWISNITVGDESVTFTTTANEGDADRTGTITLSYEGANDKVVNITQSHFVADYATLPFKFDGGKGDIENTAGLTQSGLDDDYNSSPKLKFDGTGDYVVLKFNERPGTLKFDIKGNGFSGGTFTVQTSEDGIEYTDVATYSTLEDTETKTISNLGEDVRYIKWIYTDKSSGNVALGNIALAQYVEPQAYTVSWMTGENITDIFVFAGDESEAIDNGSSVDERTTVMVSVDVAEGYELEALTVKDAEENDILLTEIEPDVYYSFVMPASNVTITATAKEYTHANYILATSITSGKHYVIASGNEDGKVKVMGDQANNNRPAVDAIIEDGVLKVSVEYEFVIESAEIDNVSGYSIYDEGVSGYLYAASSNSNYLKTQAENNTNGVWTITIDSEGKASVEAKGSNTRKVMQYNNNSSLFACYASASQSPVYLFEKVEAPETVPVTIGATGYGTLYYSDKALAIPEDMTAKYVSSVNDGMISFTELNEGVIPAGTAVVLQATQGEYKFLVVTDSETESPADNMLLGFDEQSTTVGPNGETDGYKFYMLSRNSSGDDKSVGFYWGEENGKAFQNGAHKAYLALPAGGADAKSFYLFSDAVTDGIGAVESTRFNAQGAEIYNLNGQRVSTPQRGIYIINGKKVLVK